jgi:hypothetical protein
VRIKVEIKTTLTLTLCSAHLPRITTKGKKTIKYGKVEVVAKLPKGDWLWPAIWYDTRFK